MTAVLGVDLSLTGTGLSDLHRTWTIATSGRKGDSLAQRARRLNGIRGAVMLATDGVELVVLEGPSLGQSRQGGTHDRSGLWWLVVCDLHDRAIPTVEIPPATLKRYATGRGNADKGAVIEATTRRFPEVDTAGDDNRCDALWLAHIGLDLLTGSCRVPAGHRSGLDKVTWPVAA